MNPHLDHHPREAPIIFSPAPTAHCFVEAPVPLVPLVNDTAPSLSDVFYDFYRPRLHTLATVSVTQEY
ncbi:hypothetical protein AZE42_13879 [Rhizopogon vesiculosus]|uniref:Uncharacterized protein n=1 Tax=Rhizopogon vesiculosus TaxID=180088 RepID=A0A1J8QDQ2_9AGAM|nr:hypothetical protein AZE42_13879 [Rhizopogon vesiculosus]